MNSGEDREDEQQNEKEKKEKEKEGLRLAETKKGNGKAII